MYRPNEAKVKNLKTKDYLGKARLVAAADRANAFTGFQGSEMKKAQSGAAPKDDRPTENISFAATNLVQKNLTSRSRQQSEPPINRNMFPPTPPPEMDGKSFGGNTAAPSLNGRAASVRNRQPARSETDPMPQLERSMTSMTTSSEKPRLAPIRTASEPRGPPSRQYSRDDRRDRDRRDQFRDPAQPKPLFRETTSRRPPNDFPPVNEDEYAEEVYDMYASPRSSGSRRPRQQGQRRQQDRYMDDISDYASEAYEDDSLDEVDFEMVGAPQNQRARSRRPSTSRASSRRPDIRKIRVKVHAESDTRYIMVGPAIEYGDFEGKIREKFGIRSLLRIKMRDDGDMITMGDQDDLDMLISNAKQTAKRDRNEMGKMEVSKPFRLVTCRKTY